MQTVVSSSSRWRAFWERGGWWRAVLAAAAYLVVYNLVGLAIGALFPGRVDAENIFGSAESVLFAIALPILIGGALPLLLFAISLGWVPRLFGRQPVPGRAWMWVAIPLLIVPIVLRVAGIDWSAYTVGVLLSMVLVGIAVGFTEEILTRGFAVDLLRRAGYGEKAVAVLSSTIFALLHSSNLLTGQPVLTVLLIMVYTFGFGMMMYLVLRVTGRLIWPMILHGLTDPTSFLATGGIDAHGDTAGSDGLISAAGVFNFIYPVLGAIAIIFISGRVSERRSGSTPPRTRPTHDSA